MKHTIMKHSSLLLSINISNKYLKQPVSSLQSTVLDSGSTRKNVLDVDRTLSVVKIVSRRYAESQTIRTYKAMTSCIVPQKTLY